MGGNDVAADISLLCKCSFPHKQREVQNSRVERVESVVCMCVFFHQLRITRPMHACRVIHADSISFLNKIYMIIHRSRLLTQIAFTVTVHKH